MTQTVRMKHRNRAYLRTLPRLRILDLIKLIRVGGLMATRHDTAVGALHMVAIARAELVRRNRLGVL